MREWDALFVNELNHVYNRYIKTGDTTELCLFLNAAFTSDNEFRKAYACGFIDCLKSRGVNIEVENREDCVINPPMYPPMYLRPEFIKYLKYYISTGIPEFKAYGIILQKIGDAV